MSKMRKESQFFYGFRYFDIFLYSADLAVYD